MAGAEGLGLIKLGIACLAVSFLFCDVCCQPGKEFFPQGFKKLFLGTKEDYLQMESQLEYVKSVAVKTFQTEHGNIIDCVPVDKQPSLNHPALKGHVVQKAPSFVPRGLVEKVEQPTDTEPIKLPSKTETEAQACSIVDTIFARFHDEGCPEGTIPIGRPAILDSLRKQYAGQGEGSAEQVHEKGKGSTSEARDEGDHPIEVSKSTDTSYEVNTMRISELNARIGKKQFMRSSQWFRCAPKDHLDTAEVGREAYGYKTNDWSRVDGNGLGQARRKLSPGSIFSTFKSLVY